MDDKKMSVYKSRRKDAVAKFIQQIRLLREITLQNVKKFPKGYRFVITNNMLQLAAEAYIDCIRANDIYLYKDVNQNDYELRHRYLVQAKGSVDALMSEITFLYAMIEKGDNFMKKGKERDKAFERWMNAALTANEYIKGVINSDNQRWNSYKKKRMEERK